MDAGILCIEKLESITQTEKMSETGKTAEELKEYVCDVSPSSEAYQPWPCRLSSSFIHPPTKSWITLFSCFIVDIFEAIQLDLCCILSRASILSSFLESSDSSCCRALS
jgi:hypothetical protein